MPEEVTPEEAADRFDLMIDRLSCAVFSGKSELVALADSIWIAFNASLPNPHYCGR